MSQHLSRIPQPNPASAATPAGNPCPFIATPGLLDRDTALPRGASDANTPLGVRDATKAGCVDQGRPRVPFIMSELGKSPVGKVTRDSNDLFPTAPNWIMNFCEWLRWLGSIRPIPAFGMGVPIGWWGCPNIVGFQIW